MSYFFSKRLNIGFEEALQKVTEELPKHGFGIVSEIFVTQILKEKIGADFRPYKIIGACNPNYALKALSAEDKIGLMLPCNVVVQQIDETTVEVSAIDPIASMMAIQNPRLADLAAEVQMHMKSIIENL